VNERQSSYAREREDVRGRERAREIERENSCVCVCGRYTLCEHLALYSTVVLRMNPVPFPAHGTSMDSAWGVGVCGSSTATDGCELHVHATWRVRYWQHVDGHAHGCTVAYRSSYIYMYICNQIMNRHVYTKTHTLNMCAYAYMYVLILLYTDTGTDTYIYAYIYVEIPDIDFFLCVST